MSSEGDCDGAAVGAAFRMAKHVNLTVEQKSGHTGTVSPLRTGREGASVSLAIVKLHCGLLLHVFLLACRRSTSVPEHNIILAELGATR